MDPDFRTGSCLHNPMVKAQVYPTSEIDGVLFVDVPPALEEFTAEFAVTPPA